MTTTANVYLEGVLQLYLIGTCNGLWVGDRTLNTDQQSLAISCREQINVHWDDDEIRFVLDQHAEVDVYGASSLKQQSTDIIHRSTRRPTSIHYPDSQPTSFCSFYLMLRA